MNRSDERQRERDDMSPGVDPDDLQFPDASLAEGEMTCPVCGHLMPDLRGGKATICPVCGFKDSCCF